MKLFFYFIFLLLTSLPNNYILSQIKNSSALKNEALVPMKDGRYGEAIDL